MSRDEPPGPTSFDRLLAWLDPDRDKAAIKLLKIRSTLENIFSRRRCQLIEELADEVISRVTRKLPEVEATYTGDKALYFYGFVEFVYRHHIRTINKSMPSPPPPPDPPDEMKYRCMEECMEKLTPEDRQLLRRYYIGDRKVKIDNRKALADELNITMTTLRTRAHRLKMVVGKCAKECMEKMSEESE